MASYRRVSQPQRHGRSSLCFGAEPDPPARSGHQSWRSAREQLNPLIGEKFRPCLKTGREQENCAIVLKRLEKPSLATSALRSAETKIPQDNSGDCESGDRPSEERREKARIDLMARIAILSVPADMVKVVLALSQFEKWRPNGM